MSAHGSIIPKLSSRLVTLSARFIDQHCITELNDAQILIEAARRLERGYLAGLHVDFEKALTDWSIRFNAIGDETGAEESQRLIGLSRIWKGRQ